MRQSLRRVLRKRTPVFGNSTSATAQVISLGNVVMGQVNVVLKGNTRNNICHTDADSWAQGAISQVDGSESVATNRLRTINFITVLPSTQYVISFIAGYQLYYTTYTSADAKIYSSVWSEEGTTFTTASNAVKVKLVFKKDNDADILPAEIATIKPDLEVGATISNLISYGVKSAGSQGLRIQTKDSGDNVISTVYIPPKTGGRKSLPNGTQDSLDLSTGMDTENVSRDASINAAWFAQATTNNPVGFDMWRVNDTWANLGFSVGGGTVSNYAAQLYADGVPYTWKPGWQNLNGINQFAYDPSSLPGSCIIDVVVPTGQTFDSVYGGKVMTINYQRSSPIETIVDITGEELIAYPNGTIIISLLDGSALDSTTTTPTIEYRTLVG